MSGRGVGNMLDLLEWLGATPGTHGLAEIATALSLPKSSTLLMLRTLTERGYLERLASGEYMLRRLPGDIDTSGRNGALLALVGPYLTQAVEEAGESGFLAMLEGDEIRYLNKLLPQREIRYDRDISMTRLAHKVASGIVLLAARSDADVAAYCDRQDLPEADRSTLVQAVAKARTDGFYLNLKGVVEGAAGAAAPIIAADGTTLAAINISGPQNRLAVNAAQVSEVVLNTARAVSEELMRRGKRFSKGEEA